MYAIITNNPLVKDKHRTNIEFLDSDAGSILIRARDLIHRGAKLLTHPLSGGILPGVSPYKSLIVEKTEDTVATTTDYQSLSLIENAIKLLKETPPGFEGYDEKTLEDFMVIDLDILDSAMASIIK